MGHRDRLYSYAHIQMRVSRRDGRVDDCAGLENRFTRKGNVGSNPTPSAIILSLF